jgi:hypothetical protein
VVGVALVVANQGTLTPPREQWLTRLDVGDGSSWCQVAVSMLCVKKPLASRLVAAVAWGAIGAYLVGAPFAGP